MATSPFVFALPVLFLSALAGCEGGTWPGKDTSDTSGDHTGGGGDDTEESGDSSDSDGIALPGAIHGTIHFDLYTTDEDGEYVSVDWADYYGTDFPFGSVFVSGLTLDDTGRATYWDQELIGSPDPSGSSYALEFGFDESTDLYVYAALDYWGDGLIAPYDPSGLYPSTVTVDPDSDTTDVDITISVPYYDFSITGGGWDPDAWILISGDATLTDSYAAGDCKALVYDTTGYGPYGIASFTPTATSGGATGTYSMYAPKGMGEAELLGAWDSNVNGMIDPADRWGGYSTDGDAATNITIGSSDMTGYDLTIPLGTEPISIVPFVVDGGNVLLDDLTMALVTSSSKLYVTAQKYRPSGAFDPTDASKTYDDVVFDSSEISDTNPYSLLLPANTVTYLWACLDVDGDGTVNEAGETCGQPTSDGKIATGTSSDTGIEFWLHTMALASTGSHSL